MATRAQNERSQEKAMQLRKRYRSDRRRCGSECRDNLAWQWDYSRDQTAVVDCGGNDTGCCPVVVVVVVAAAAAAAGLADRTRRSLGRAGVTWWRILRGRESQC